MDSEHGLDEPGGKQLVRRTGDISTEIGEIKKEIRALTVAFDEERSFLTTAYNRCTLVRCRINMDFVVL